MRAFLIVWLTPGSLFWSWHLLSINDIVFSRASHDQTFAIYGDLLGMAPADIPMMFARAFATDSLLILALLAFRKRKAIFGFLRRQWATLAARGHSSIEISRSSTP